jgi:putative ABC transport system permease protein
MIRHLFKLVWNRKRVNALILAEIFISFIVLCVVATAVVYHIDCYRQPTGFRYENVWRVWPDTKLPMGRQYRQARLDGKQSLYLAMKDLPEIESIAATTVTPYSTSTSLTNWGDGKVMHETELALASDDAAAVLGLHVVQGRWFDKTDDASPDGAIVINARLARELFRDANPIGQMLDTSQSTRGRIVGVIEEFRKGGEFARKGNFLFERLVMTDTAARRDWWGFVIKLREGTDAAFQGKLARVLAATQKTWSFDITPLANARTKNFQVHLAPLIAVGLIAGFLLLMVGLGLVGVLWQNVSQRTREIGVRRALGGSAEMVYRQILGELLVIATLGIAAASAVVLQVPLLNLIDFVTPAVYVVGFSVSIALMYLLTILCGLYPSWLAMDIHPSEALHYE